MQHPRITQSQCPNFGPESWLAYERIVLGYSIFQVSELGIYVNPEDLPKQRKGVLAKIVRIVGIASVSGR